MQSRGWLTKLVENSEHLLQFADGNLATIVGQMYATWDFPNKHFGPTTTRLVAFEIPHDYPFNVVLCQDFLEATDAFMKFKEFFHEVYTQRRLVGLSLGVWLPNFLTKTAEPMSTGEDINSPSRQNALLTSNRRRGCGTNARQFRAC